MSSPAARLNISLIRSLKPPSVDMLSLPGLAFACATSSPIVFTGRVVLAATTNGWWNVMATGAKSWSTSKAGFFCSNGPLVTVLLATSSVCPSGAARATYAAPSVPAAGTVFDHRLAERLLELRREIAGDQVGGRARRKRHDQRDRPARKGGAPSAAAWTMATIETTNATRRAPILRVIASSRISVVRTRLTSPSFFARSAHHHCRIV